MSPALKWHFHPFGPPTPADAAVNTPDALHTSRLQSLEKIYSGKVRDVYAVGDDQLLIIATDRISAYDVILPGVIPGKGKLLTELALYWFKAMEGVIGNHLSTRNLEDILDNPQDLAQARGRSMLVQRLQALPVEAVVRGYIIGSGWRDYQQSGEICGISLPAGLSIASKLAEPVFTPATKAAVGEHDENIPFERMVDIIGEDLAIEVRDVSQTIYLQAREYASTRGIIIADTKFEFGLDTSGKLILMDEILTPDSSRFWPAEEWQPGTNPSSFDKQFVRDYLETLDWDKTAPGPELPENIVAETLARYRQAVSLLTSTSG